MSTGKLVRPVDILLIEDNQGDIRLTREALKEGKLLNTLIVAQDGIEAMAILRREGKYKDQDPPDLIVLDLNLPKKDGREVLSDIKTDPELHRIPVAVLTTSSAEEDILRSYDLHANCYITKPLDIDRFIEKVKSIENFWFSIVTLPDGSP